MFDSILFDLDGTLTDSFDGVANSIIYALKKLGRTLPAKDTLRWCLGPPLRESFLKLLDGNMTEADKAVSLYREYYADKGIFENRVYDGIPAALQKLKDDDKHLFVATSKPETFAKRIIEKYELDKYFEFTAGATLDMSRAEKHQVIAYAAETCGIDPTRAIMVGDRHHDIAGASVNGMMSIGVLYGYGDEIELKSAGASFIATTPDDIVNIILSDPI